MPELAVPGPRANCSDCSARSELSPVEHLDSLIEQIDEHDDLRSTPSSIAVTTRHAPKLVNAEQRYLGKATTTTATRRGVRRREGRAADGRPLVAARLAGVHR